MESNTHGYCRSCRCYYYKLFDGVCRDCIDRWDEFPSTRPPACPKASHYGHAYLQCPDSDYISDTGYVSL